MNHVSFPLQPLLAPSNQHPEPLPPPKKLRRISKACDFCHKRSIRCKSSNEEPGCCQNCFDFGVPCQYLRPTKKRGIKSGSSKGASENSISSRDGESDARMLLELTQGLQDSSFNVVDQVSISERWNSVASGAIIKNLVNVYFQVVYPM